MSDSSAPTRKRSASTAKEAKKRKVNVACLYCKRSHMNCSSDRPCERCTRRGIAHLCIEDGQSGPSSSSSTVAPPLPQPIPANADPLKVKIQQPVPNVSPSNSGSHSSYESFDSSSSSTIFPAPTSVPHPPPSDFYFAGPNIQHVPPTSEPSIPPLPPTPGPLQPPPQQHPPPHQTFAHPPSAYYPQRIPLALAPTPLETTPITSPRTWTGMEDANMNGLGGHGMDQAGIEGLAEMFGKGGDEWGSLSGFLDSLDLPISASASNQPSPSGGNSFSPFPFLNNGAVQSPSNGISNPPTPGFTNGFQHDPLDQRHSQLMALFESYKARLPSTFPHPTVNPNSKTSFPPLQSPLLPPPPAPTSNSSSSSNHQQQQQPQIRYPAPLQPPPHQAPTPLPVPAPAPSSSSGHSNHSHHSQLSPYPLHHPLLQQQQSLQPQNQQQLIQYSQLPIPSALAPPVKSFAEILQAKYESSELAKAEEGWDWERGWAKLDDWMRENVSTASSTRIHSPLSIFRPTVRAILAGLTKEDKVLVEESFQRMLLNYDRVLNVVKTPSCLWRRTGEIFKANVEFANLIGVHIDWFRDGKVGIYELMKEDSAVNFWEQYFQVGFDRTRKAVLTTCTLSAPTRLLTPPGGRKSSSKSSSSTKRKVEIPCCFSFTVQRDSWGVPVVVMGNFLEIA
ncbi:hypothetical protein BDY24DRAFT_432550 [Mrakia frigida]|uniref:Zn(II)2Cys6 transcription factor domain-containing protein n=1 Tax=Mrakia frigida TaxID=29902 RepID=UPI003FCBF54A